MAKDKAADERLAEMRKGDEILEVHPTAVAAHLALGWELVDAGDGDVIAAIARRSADADAARLRAEQSLAAVDAAREEVAALRAENTALKARLDEAQADARRQAEAHERAANESVKRAGSGDDERAKQLKEERDTAVKQAVEAEARAKAVEAELAKAKEAHAAPKPADKPKSK